MTDPKSIEGSALLSPGVCVEEEGRRIERFGKISNWKSAVASNSMCFESRPEQCHIFPLLHNNRRFMLCTIQYSWELFHSPLGAYHHSPQGAIFQNAVITSTSFTDADVENADFTEVIKQASTEKYSLRSFWGKKTPGNACAEK